MNCDCIKTVEQKMIGREWKKRKILKAELQTVIKMLPKFETITCSSLTVTIEGKKGESKIDILRLQVYEGFNLKNK